MKSFYAAMYSADEAPWEVAGRAGREQMQRLFATETAERRPGRHRALDIGCGRGTHSLALADEGWTVTAVDYVASAIEQARARPGAERVTFVVGDATDLRTVVQGPFDLFVDVGCFHGLEPEERVAYGEEVHALAGPDATLLLLAFEPGAPPPLPVGVLTQDIEAALPGWSIIHREAITTQELPVPDVAMRWYRLRHQR